MRRVAVLVDALHGRDVRLEFGAHAHEPVERLRDVQRVADGEASEAGTNCIAREHGKQGGKDGHQIADELKAQRQPSVGHIVGKVEEEALVDVGAHRANEALLDAVRANAARARERLAEVREYGRLAGRLHALELSHGGDKVALRYNVNDEQRHERDDEQRRRVADHQHGEKHVENATDQRSMK